MKFYMIRAEIESILNFLLHVSWGDCLSDIGMACFYSVYLIWFSWNLDSFWCIFMCLFQKKNLPVLENDWGA